jgi:hypothetical protein
VKSKPAVKKPPPKKMPAAFTKAAEKVFPKGVVMTPKGK